MQIILMSSRFLSSSFVLTTPNFFTSIFVKIKLLAIQVDLYSIASTTLLELIGIVVPVEHLISTAALSLALPKVGTILQTFLHNLPRTTSKSIAFFILFIRLFWDVGKDIRIFLILWVLVIFEMKIDVILWIFEFEANFVHYEGILGILGSLSIFFELVSLVEFLPELTSFWQNFLGLFGAILVETIIFGLLRVIRKQRPI